MVVSTSCYKVYESSIEMKDEQGEDEGYERNVLMDCHRLRKDLSVDSIRREPFPRGESDPIETTQSQAALPNAGRASQQTTDAAMLGIRPHSIRKPNHLDTFTHGPIKNNRIGTMGYGRTGGLRSVETAELQ